MQACTRKLYAMAEQVLTTPLSTRWDEMEDRVYQLDAVVGAIVQATSLPKDIARLIAMCPLPAERHVVSPMLCASMSSLRSGSLSLGARRLLCLLWAGPSGVRAEAARYATGGADTAVSSIHWQPARNVGTYVCGSVLTKRARQIGIQRQRTQAQFQFDSVNVWSHKRTRNGQGIIAMTENEAFAVMIWIANRLAPQLAQKHGLEVEHVLDSLLRIRTHARARLQEWDTLHTRTQQLCEAAAVAAGPNRRATRGESRESRDPRGQVNDDQQHGAMWNVSDTPRATKRQRTHRTGTSH
jgi:hypothetical protein